MYNIKPYVISSIFVFGLTISQAYAITPADANTNYQGPPSTNGSVSQDPAQQNHIGELVILNGDVNHPKEATTATQTPEQKKTNSFDLE
jgi:hypothetical protein